MSIMYEETGLVSGGRILYAGKEAIPTYNDSDCYSDLINLYPKLNVAMKAIKGWLSAKPSTVKTSAME